MKVTWSYEDDFIILDENLSLDEKRELLESGNNIKTRRVLQRERYLKKHKFTKEKLEEEMNLIIDCYPDYVNNHLQRYLNRPYQYFVQRIKDLKVNDLLRENCLLNNKIKDYIKLSIGDKKAIEVAEELGLPLNLVKLAIWEIETQKRKEEFETKENFKIEPMPKKIKWAESQRPKNALDKRIIRHKKYKDNALYEVTGDNGKFSGGDFKGRLIYQNEEFILLKHKLGYKESFNKVDFETGEREIKEVAK